MITFALAIPRNLRHSAPIVPLMFATVRDGRELWPSLLTDMPVSSYGHAPYSCPCHHTDFGSSFDSSPPAAMISASVWGLSRCESEEYPHRTLSRPPRSGGRAYPVPVSGHQMKYSWMVCLYECAAEGVFLLPWVDIWKDSARHKPEGSSGGFQINDFHPVCLFRKF